MPGWYAPGGCGELRADAREHRAQVLATHLDAEITEHARLARRHRHEPDAEPRREIVVLAVADLAGRPARVRLARDVDLVANDAPRRRAASACSRRVARDRRPRLRLRGALARRPSPLAAATGARLDRRAARR